MVLVSVRALSIRPGRSSQTHGACSSLAFLLIINIVIIIIIVIIINIVIINIVLINIVIIITRPKPAYGRQGLAESWGQDTDEVSTFLVSLTSHFAPAALSSDLNNLGPLMTMKIHLETLKNHGKQPKTMKTMKPPRKPMETNQKP